VVVPLARCRVDASAIGMLLTAYTIVLGLFGLWFYSFFAHTGYAANPGMAAYKPPPATVIDYGMPARLPVRHQQTPPPVEVSATTLLFGNSSVLLAQPPDQASRLYNKARELYKAGRYGEAIPIAQQVLTIRESALGCDHPDVAAVLFILGFLYDIQSRYSNAEPLYQRSLAIREKVLGPDHLDVGNC